MTIGSIRLTMGVVRSTVSKYVARRPVPVPVVPPATR